MPPSRKELMRRAEMGGVSDVLVGMPQSDDSMMMVGGGPIMNDLLLTTGTLGRQAEFDRRRKKKWVYFCCA